MTVIFTAAINGCLCGPERLVCVLCAPRPGSRDGHSLGTEDRQPLVTTDYIIDELLTLLKIRESHPVAAAAGEALLQHNVAE